MHPVLQMSNKAVTGTRRPCSGGRSHLRLAISRMACWSAYDLLLVARGSDVVGLNALDETSDLIDPAQLDPIPSDVSPQHLGDRLRRGDQVDAVLS